MLLLLAAVLYVASAMNNGVARTPPMGWLSWQRFRCETDCTTYPDNCINAKLYMDMADRLAADGWKELGYTQVNIDDCWSLKVRDNKTNEQVPDPDRFPNGIKGVADYVHSKGLKLGLYNDIGTKTCGGYTGIDGNYELDANTFVSWDIDMIKIDGCNGNVADYYQMYPAFGAALNKTGKAIIYSCSWPAYISGHGEDTNPVKDNTTLVEIAKYCNLWRNYADIQDSWDSTQGIIKYWARNYANYSEDQFLYVAGPGQWNDPDMIIGGDNGLSLSEATTQFALWAIFAAPLLMSNDLRTISPEFKALLQNKDIIDVNQDPMGKQGGVVYSGGSQTIYMRELADNNSLAIVFQNSATSGFGFYMGFETYLVPSFVNGWSKNTKFTVRNLVNNTDLGTFDAYFEDLIEPSSVGMYKLTPVATVLVREQMIYININGSIIMVTLLAISCIITLVTMIFILFKRKNDVIKAANLKMNIIICIGAIIAYIATILFTFDEHYKFGQNTLNTMCNLRFWLLTISFTLVFIPLFVKTFRLFKAMLTNKNIPDNSDSKFVSILLICIMIDIILLTILTIIKPMERVIDSSYTQQIDELQQISYIHGECGFADHDDGDDFNWNLYALIDVFKLLEFIWGIWVTLDASRIRDITNMLTTFDETGLQLLSILLTFIILCISIPIYGFGPINNPNIHFLIISLSVFFIGNIVVSLNLFPRIFAVITGTEDEYALSPMKEIKRKLRGQLRIEECEGTPTASLKRRNNESDTE